MKKILLTVLVLALASGFASAEGKMAVGIGADVILPLDSGFSDAYSIGFGATARGQYMINDVFTVMATTGFLTFSGKDVNGFKLDNATMIPILIGGKYYFTPGTMRFYGAADLGISIFSVSAPTVTIPGFGTVGGGSASSSEFTFQPQVGFESALGSGGSKLDVGVRAVIISNAFSLGARVGVLFPLGN